MTETNTSNESLRPLRIAVIGSGPAGVYSSDILLKQLAKRAGELGLPAEARIDLFEKLPVPFGLVRYGVAPDHPSIKFIAGALEKTLDNPNIHLYCDVEFGKDVTLDELLERYDAVLFATGAVKDKPLNLPGADLDGVYGAAKFVEWYDGYPTGARTWPLTAETVAVIGGGNVAMDVARELMRNADDLAAKTDIPDNVYDGIKANKAKVLHLFIRRGVAQAKFSVQELREMEKLPGVQLIINEDDFDLDDETIEVAGKDKLTRQMVEELFTIREMAEDMEDDGDVDYEGNPADRKYYVHFNSAPTEILGEDGKVTAIRVERTETGADGKMHRTGEFEDYPVEAVYHAIGYKPASAPGIAYDEKRTTLANKDGRILTAVEGGEVRPRLYSTGWAKRGPVGLIGSTKSDALFIVNNMLEDFAATPEHGLLAPDADPESIDRLLAEKGIKPIDFAGWKRVDAYERAEGAKRGREHVKVVEPEQMRALAHGE
ncbi:FAD-dependent oxidoreductase [Bifidobacterium simiarum]|uniref:FAD-dependent oxidoreductase n=1 Tax=Bifidobacterium simiarum TaxID=2045441 RepID=UPI001BDC6F1F|nr:FAD-dependent oxidoreductase [Bifidobacterium simiarum]